MNWITKFIKPKIKSLFEKRSSKIKENLWIACECKNLIYKEDLQSNLKCCPKCGAHHKLSCKERFETFFDNKEYELIETPLPQDDPLQRQPDISLAKAQLHGWEPQTQIKEGLIKTIAYFEKQLKK